MVITSAAVGAGKPVESETAYMWPFFFRLGALNKLTIIMTPTVLGNLPWTELSG